MIRAKMEDYDKGKTDIKELSKFSTPKLQDAIKEVEDLEYFMRIDVHNNVVSKIVKSDYLDNYNLSKIDLQMEALLDWQIQHFHITRKQRRCCLINSIRLESYQNSQFAVHFQI